MSIRKSLALFAVALLALTIVAAPTAAAELGSQTVTVDDPDAEEIEATVELTDDPAAQNTAIKLLNESGQAVETVSLEGSSGDNVTEIFTVDAAGNYTVSVTADSSGSATLHSAEVVEKPTGLFGSASKEQQFLWFGAVGVIAVIGVLGFREYNDGY